MQVVEGAPPLLSVYCDHHDFSTDAWGGTDLTKGLLLPVTSISAERISQLTQHGHTLRFLTTAASELFCELADPKGQLVGLSSLEHELPELLAAWNVR